MEKIITSESSRNPEDPRRLADVLDRLERIERKIDRLDEQGREPSAMNFAPIDAGMKSRNFYLAKRQPMSSASARGYFRR